MSEMSERVTPPKILPVPVKPWKITHSSYGFDKRVDGYTEEAKAAYLAKWQEHQESVRVFNQWREETLRLGLEALTQLGFSGCIGHGRGQKTLAQVLAQLLPYCPLSYEPSFWEEDQVIKEARLKVEAKQRELDKVGHLLRAHTYLLQHGKVQGVDFTEHNVEASALELAAAPIIEGLKAKGWVTFSGDDNCEDCRGWNGEDRRCDCGNWRVEWNVSGSFEDPLVYAEAW